MTYEPEPRIDPPEDEIFDYCDHCGHAIYEGEAIYDIDGKLIHEECLEDFAKAYFAHCKIETRNE